MVGLTELVYHSLQLELFLHPRSEVYYLSATKIAKIADYFFNTSGRLILIIAVDRCIHMRCLTKYTTIMTQFRARVIVSFNFIIGFPFLIPHLLPSKGYIKELDFFVNIFNTGGTLLIYVIYIKTYFSIKRQVAALQTIKSNDIVVQNSAKTNQCHSGPSTAQHCTGRTRINTMKEHHFGKTCLHKKNNVIHESQQEAYVLPESAAISPYKANSKSKNANHIENKAHFSRAVKRVIVLPVSEVKIENGVPIGIKQENKEQNLERKCLQKQQQRQRFKPEREFRKATWLILSVLFICYFPTFINNFYSYAGGRNMIFKSICGITVLLNSSLNAVILIASNRELKGHIKVIFTHV